MTHWLGSSELKPPNIVLTSHHCSEPAVYTTMSVVTLLQEHDFSERSKTKNLTIVHAALFPPYTARGRNSAGMCTCL